MVAAYGWPVLLAGFVTAWISAAIAVKWMVAYLNRHGLAVFAWWRFAAAGLAALLLSAQDSVMNLVTRQASSPSMPSSDPWPLSFTPPNGASGTAIVKLLMPSMPDSTCSPSRFTRFDDCVNA